MEESKGETQGEIMGAGEEEEAENRPLLSLKIHETIMLAQGQNGLRQGSHESYHRYCSRRLRRVRTRKGIRHTYGKGRAFQPRELTAEAATASGSSSSKYLLIPLFLAERAWSHGMEIKQQVGDEGGNTGEEGGRALKASLHHHFLRRLAKACSWARKLEELCVDVANDRTIVEAHAYAAWLSGTLMMEKMEWGKALGSFTVASDVCEKLGTVGSIEEQDVFTQRAVELKPILRFCARNLELSGQDQQQAEDSGSSVVDSALIASKLDAVLADAEARSAISKDNESAMALDSTSALPDVNWRGKKVAVRSTALQKKLATAESAAEELRGSRQEREALYLKTFASFDDALVTLGKELAKLQGKGGGGAKMEGLREELRLLTAYASYTKLTLMRERNEGLVVEFQGGGQGQGEQGGDGAAAAAAAAGVGAAAGGAVVPAADIVHIYDALLQGVRDMRVAVSTGRDGDDNDQDDHDHLDEDDGHDDMIERLQADAARYRAARCSFVALAYEQQGKWAEATALYERAKGLCAEAAALFAILDGGEEEEEEEGGGQEHQQQQGQELEALSARVEGGLCRAQAQALLVKIRGRAAGKTSNPSATTAGSSSSSNNNTPVTTTGKGKKGKGRGGDKGGSSSSSSSSSGNSGGGGGEGVEKAPQLALLERIEQGVLENPGADGNLHIANVPPLPSPIPFKPVLLDLAYNHIAYPDLREKAGQAPKGAGAAGGSLKSWVGWALGR